MEAPATREFISDAGAQRLLGIDEFSLLNLILDFDLIPYRKKADAPDDYEIAHDASFADPMELIFEIVSLKFRRADVEALKAIPGWQSSKPAAPKHQLKRLEVRRANILKLKQSRDQLAMGPSKLLRVALAASKRRIAAYSEPVKPKDRSQAPAAKFDLPNGTRWEQITIKIIGAGKKAEIITPQMMTPKRLAYAELGFGDQRGGGQPTASWMLLVKFAVEKNIERPSSPQKASAFRKSVSNLSKALTTIFGINENPFCYAKKAGYAPKFNLLDRIDKKSFADANDRVDDVDDDDIGAVYKATIAGRKAEVEAEANRKKCPRMDEQSSNKR